MRRTALLMLSLLLLAACESGGVQPASSTTPGSTAVSTTPTTDPGRECRRVMEDAVEFFTDALEALDTVTAAELIDRGRWPEALHRLEARGEELDRRAAELGCDPGMVQQAVLAEAAGLEAQGPISRLLLDLLLPGG